MGLSIDGINLAGQTALITGGRRGIGRATAYGTSVFNLAPGTVLTTMTQYVLDSPSGRKWQPELRKVFDDGRDVPPDEAARLIVYLASGQADVLTGRYVSVSYDVPAMARDAERIKDADLFTMRLRS